MLINVMAVALAAAQAAAPAEPAPQAVIQAAPAAVIAPAPQAVILAPVSGSVLRAGTEVPLRLEENLDSNNKALREGQQFRMYFNRMPDFYIEALIEELDAYIGIFVETMLKTGAAVSKLKNKEIEYSELLNFSSFDDAKSTIHIA